MSQTISTSAFVRTCAFIFCIGLAASSAHGGVFDKFRKNKSAQKEAASITNAVEQAAYTGLKKKVALLPVESKVVLSDPVSTVVTNQAAPSVPPALAGLAVIAEVMSKDDDNSFRGKGDKTDKAEKDKESTAAAPIPVPSDLPGRLDGLFSEALQNTGRFIVLDSNSTLVKVGGSEALLASSGQSKSNATPSASEFVGQVRLLGAQMLVKATLTACVQKKSSMPAAVSILNNFTAKFGNDANAINAGVDAEVAFDVHLYDANGQAIGAKTVTGESKASLSTATLMQADSTAQFNKTAVGEACQRALVDAVDFISKSIEDMPWEGRIAEIETEPPGKVSGIYVNAGSRMGLKKGDELQVLRAGKTITDSGSGIAIGRMKDKKIGICRIDSVTADLAIASPVEGEGFQKEDVVQIIEPSLERPSAK